MPIFQDYDEMNYPVGDYLEMLMAAETADDLLYWPDKYKLQSELAEEELSWLGIA